MSFSITARAKTKEEVKQMLRAQLTAEVERQPLHSADKEAALAVAETYLNLVEPKEGHDMSVQLNGHLGIDRNESDDTPGPIRVSSVTCTVSQINTPA